jgi:hypothetical protein
MAKHKFALEKGQPARLEVDTKFSFNGATVYFDGNQIAVIPDRTSFSRGTLVPLPDGSMVNIQLQTTFAGTNLLITRNGVALPGSGGDPQTKLKTAYGIIYFVAIVSAIAGVIGVILPNSMIALLGYGWGSIISAAVFGLLGFFTQRKSKAALIIAIILLIMDGIATLIFAATSGINPTSGLLGRAILIIAMFPGVKAIDELKKSQVPAIPTIK